MKRGRIHVVVGDTQVKPGVPTDHLTWISKYVVEKYAGRDLSVIHVGDHWDLPSLSSYDKGKRGMEGRRYIADVKAGGRALVRFMAPFVRERARSGWWPKFEFFIGNHEHRIVRATEDDAQLEGLLSLDDLNARELGWRVHPFLKPVRIDGVTYAHYFYNPNTGRPYGGENVETRLKTIGYSFTQGHQQGARYGMRPVGGRRHHGLINGSCYLHDEKYIGPQGANHWRGIVVCHEVAGGDYDAKFVSLAYLCRKFTGKTLKQFMRTTKSTAARAA